MDRVDIHRYRKQLDRELEKVKMIMLGDENK